MSESVELNQRRPGRPLLLDGAMGTALLAAGGDLDTPLELLNIVQPQMVLAVHGAYARAGVDILTTNSFGANRFRLATFGMQNRAEELNRAAVALARTAASNVMSVAGTIGPTGLQDELPCASDLRAGFREQAAALGSAGVDLFSCETFGAIEELRAAILGIRDVSDRPILASMTYSAELRTRLGLSPRQVAQALADLPIAALGANCSTEPDTEHQVIRELQRHTDIPLIAQPNAGLPHAGDSGPTYPIDPQQFALECSRMAPMLAYVGGCCGTSAAHLTALRRKLSTNLQS